METIDISLKATGLDEIFPLHKRFSSQMVERGKPHPDIFLLVAEKMSVDPQDCMVIEDSPAGVQAARVARMNFIWYGLGSHVSQAYGSDVLYFMTEHFKKMPNMK
jgi:beta-phosphoglucomutase-like phosphatase (HAD superfamily)